jgi:hypothetical protein
VQDGESGDGLRDRDAVTDSIAAVDRLLSLMCPRYSERYTSYDAVIGLAPDPGAERLDSDAEWRENSGEELVSHFN